MQLTDEPDKRCYPLENHLLCHSCHIKRLNQQYPDEQFYIDPQTYSIHNKGSDRNPVMGAKTSIAITPAPKPAYMPSSRANQDLSVVSNAGYGNRGNVSHQQQLSTPSSQNSSQGFQHINSYSFPSPMPTGNTYHQPTGSSAQTRYQITDL